MRLTFPSHPVLIQQARHCPLGRGTDQPVGPMSAVFVRLRGSILRQPVQERPHVPLWVGLREGLQELLWRHLVVDVERPEGPGMIGVLSPFPLEPRMPYPFLLLKIRDGLVREVLGFHPQRGLAGGVIQLLGAGIVICLGCPVCTLFPARRHSSLSFFHVLDQFADPFTSLRHKGFAVQVQVGPHLPCR